MKRQANGISAAIAYLLFEKKMPVILVARGCLAPYFLNWWKANCQGQLYVLDFSRWRWLGGGEGPVWVESAAPPKGDVVLFDRNTATGLTLKFLKQWLICQEYSPVVVGHLEPNLCRFGLQFIDYVWDDHAGLFSEGGTCREPSVDIVHRDEYMIRCTPKGEYTICVIGGAIHNLGGSCVRPGYIGINDSNFDVPDNTCVFQNVRNWRQAMLLSYSHAKPLITVAMEQTARADYYLGSDDLSEVRQLVPG